MLSPLRLDFESLVHREITATQVSVQREVELPSETMAAANWFSGLLMMKRVACHYGGSTARLTWRPDLL